MLVKQIMTTSPVWVPPTTPLPQALELVDELGIRHLPVFDTELVGILSDRDLLEELSWSTERIRARERERGRERKHTVAQIMHTDVMTVSPDDTVVGAAVTLVCESIGCLPVLEGGRLVGMVTETDLLSSYETLCDRSEHEVDVDPRVRDVMSSQVVDVGRGTTLEDALIVARSNRVRHLPVVTEGRLSGILSDRDLRTGLSSGKPRELRAFDVMTHEVTVIGPGARLSDAAHAMARASISSLPVVEDGRLVGMLTVTDVLDHCVNVMGAR